MSGPELIETDGVPIRAWVRGAQLELPARRQLENVARLPIVFRHVAAMPDVHWGIGATVGSVIPTERAIIPAAVGVDIGCGMMAVETTLDAAALPDSLRDLRGAIEEAVPHGRSDNGGRHDRYLSSIDNILAIFYFQVLANLIALLTATSLVRQPVLLSAQK